MFRFCLCILLLVAASVSATADAVLSENFDDLVLPGWTETNNSAPLGSTGWFLGNSMVFPSYAGAPDAYIAANFNNAGFGGNISNWLLTPELPLASGDSISFFTRASAVFADRLEVRLSTNGGSADVGATDSSVGDFGLLLLTINPALSPAGYPDAWTEFTATLAGPIGSPTGRYAFRYSVPDTSVNADYIGIDSVTVNHVVPEPAGIFAVALPAAFVFLQLRRRARTAHPRKKST